jgi:hypothetical protein
VNLHSAGNNDKHGVTGIAFLKEHGSGIELPYCADSRQLIQLLRRQRHEQSGFG